MMGLLAPPDAGRLLSISSPVIVTCTLAAALLYALGIRSLAAKGRRWPPARTAAFASGALLVTIGLGSGMARYEDATFSVHMTQHLLVGMLGPMLLAASGAITLALQTAPLPVRRGLREVVHSTAAQRLTHPLVGFALFVSALVLSVWPPVVQLAIRHGAFHGYLHLHLLLAGAILWWPVVGVDRSLRAAPGASLLAVAAMIPVHAFVAVSLLSAGDPVGGLPFTEIARGWELDPLADQRTGAAILWIGGELVTILAGVVIGRRWYLADRRAARQADRRLHPELEPA